MRRRGAAVALAKSEAPIGRLKIATRTCIDGGT